MNAINVVVINMLDLGGGSDTPRQSEELNGILNHKYDLIVIFNLYPELYKKIENFRETRGFSLASETGTILLYRNEIEGKFVEKYYGTHVVNVLKVKCKGFIVILFNDSGNLLDVNYLNKFILDKKNVLLITHTMLDFPEIKMKSPNPTCGGLTINHSESEVYKFHAGVTKSTLTGYLSFTMKCDDLERFAGFKPRIVENIEDFNGQTLIGRRHSSSNVDAELDKIRRGASTALSAIKSVRHPSVIASTYEFPVEEKEAKKKHKGLKKFWDRFKRN